MPERWPSLNLDRATPDVFQPTLRRLRPPYGAVSFNPATPARINATQPIRSIPPGSPSIAIPQASPPAAPIPVQTAYTVPIGNTRSAWDMQKKLATIAATVATLGNKRLNPSDCFSSTTQATSPSPANASQTQGLSADAAGAGSNQAAFCFSRFIATTVSAICTAFSAAPLRRLSDTHQNAMPFSTVGSRRMRLTKVASSPAQSTGVM